MQIKKKQKKAVVLLSGGMDSATVLAIAQHQGYQVYALSFNYGQRHSAELKAAKRVSQVFSVEEHRIHLLDLSSFGGSALTDVSIQVPVASNAIVDEIPVTYVPARNTVFLSIALAWAEVLGADDIFIGVTAVDYSGYPDCRPEYIEAYEKMANLALKSAVEGNKLNIQTPLIDMGKAAIIKKGTELGIDYSMTVTCYQADEQGRACGQCDSCRLRAEGFTEANITDTTRYQPHP